MTLRKERIGHVTEALIVAVTSVVASVLASSGFWSYKQSRDTKKDATLQLLLGLAHDRIVFLGMSYVDRGWITKDEYEDFIKYLYKPYSEFGGNGLAEKIMDEVKKLPISGNNHTLVQVIKEKHVHPVGEQPPKASPQ